MNHPQRQAFRHRKHAGTSLAFTAVLLAALLGFLGVSIYVGLTSYAQNELQKAVLTAAMVGASSYYDGATAGSIKPVKDGAKATQAATATLTNIIGSSPYLSSVAQGAGNVSLFDANDAICVEQQAMVPTPFLAPINIPGFQVNARSCAKYVMQVQNGISIDPLSGNLFQIIPLNEPLVDGPGADMFVEAGSQGGYMIEACSNTQCWDIGGAAQLSNGDGVIRQQTINGMQRTVIYGDAYFDIGASGGFYTNQVKKAAYLRVVDDGVADAFQGGQRMIELGVSPLTINRVEVYHNATACLEGAACVVPRGFLSGPPG